MSGYKGYTGDCNTGDCNAGDCNAGDCNAGDCNTGNSNTGNWNMVDSETGFLNTAKSETIRVFNVDCDRASWELADKPNFMYFNLTEWVDDQKMTDQEKIDNPTFNTTGGYLKVYGYKEAFQRSWDKATPEDRALVEKLPNFDADVFFEISGIDIRKQQNPSEITIDGATYVLKVGDE